MDVKNTTSRNGATAPVQKHRGFRHLFAAASYSFGGAKRLIARRPFGTNSSPSPSRWSAFAIVGANLFQYVAMAILFLLMMAFEAINTAIEEIVDASRRRSRRWAGTQRISARSRAFASFSPMRPMRCT